MIKKDKFFLFLILLLAFFLRFYKVTEVPPSLNWDETSIAYNAYSILKTGRDEWGQLLPVHFRSYGEYKLPAQIYASIPGVAVFGLNELGVRITPVVYGTLTVLFIFFLASQVSGNKFIGLISAFLLAISPWHIHLTRASFESSFSIAWVTLGAWFAVKGLKEKKFLLLSVVPFVIAMYTYNSARVFVPMFLAVCFLIYKRSLQGLRPYKKELLKNIKTLFLCILIFALSMIPILTFLFQGEATARFKLVSIVDDPGFTLRINEARGKVKLPEPLPRLIHNKVTHFVYVFGENYLAHFTPQFLFISGAPHKQHHVQGVGQFYMWQAPFILAGLYYLFKKKRTHRWFLVWWILLSFVPVSVTRDSIPHALRTLLAVVPYEIVCAYGIYWLYRVIKDRNSITRSTITFILAFVVAISMQRYLNNYYNIYPKLYSRDWQYGYKQVEGFIKEHYKDYDLIVFSRHYGEPHMFTLFFLGWDPGKFQNDPNLIRFESYDWVWVLKFDKFYFPDLGDTGTKFEDIRKENPGKKILFIGKQGDFPDYFPRLLTVDFLNGDRAFEAVEVK